MLDFVAICIHLHNIWNVKFDGFNTNYALDVNKKMHSKKQKRLQNSRIVDNNRINMVGKVKISWDPLKWILTKKKMLVEFMMTNEVFSKKTFL